MRIRHIRVVQTSRPRQTRRRKSVLSVVALGALLACSLWVTGDAVAVAPPDANRSQGWGTLTTLSKARPFHLVQSTGNLYWTANTDPNSNGVAFSRIYRMSKAGSPGTARVLYQESHDGTPYFAALSYAKLGTRYYAFFVVNDPANHTSVIKRVWLGGGAARTIATSPGYIGSRDLVTDGTYLFWADEKGLRRTKLDGKARATLHSSPGLGQVAISEARVFFADDRAILSALKVGGDFASELRAASVVTDLSVEFSDSAGYSILRGEKNGSVRASFRGGVGEVTYQTGSGSRKAISVFSNGSRVFWTDCGEGVGAPSNCRARVRSGRVQLSVPASSFADHIQGDGGGMYWTDALGLRRFSQ